MFWRATIYLLCAIWWCGVDCQIVLAAVSFQFTYQDLVQRTGTGFDDPTEGQARREALEDVANQLIGQQLNHTAVVRVTVNLSRDLSGVTLAEAGQNYVISPSSFQNGIVATRIQSGSNSPGEVGGSMTWDFTHNWHTGTDPPPKGKNDFRSVALHELTHLMGISSLIKEDGRGLQGTFFDTYARFDAQVENENGVRLISSGRFNTIGGASLSDLTLGTYYVGTNAQTANNGTRVLLFTPDPFEGSSIGHVNDPDDPLAHQLRVATTRRHWSLVDRGILLDLGYSIPDAVVADRDEVLSATSLDISRSLYIGGDSASAGLAGSLTVEASATVDVNSFVALWEEGVLTVDGTLSAVGDVLNNGIVGGQGRITTHLHNVSGTVAPGNSAGRLRVNEFTQNTAGTLEVEIGGSVGGSQHDVLQVDNTASLGGLLDVKTIGTYTEPTVRGTFDAMTVLEADNVSGSFDVILYNDEPLTAQFSHSDGSFGMATGAGHFRNVIPTNSGITIQNVVAVPGDTDGNLAVNLVDFNQLAVSYAPFGSTSDLTWLQGDFDGDNDIDVFDFNALAIRFNQDLYRPASSALVGVPEPSAALLLAFCSLMLLYFSARTDTSGRQYLPGPARRRCLLW